MVDEQFDAKRSDGAAVHIRPVLGSDGPDMRALNARISDQSNYRRFFTVSRFAGEDYCNHLLGPGGERRFALVALIDGELVAVAAYEFTDAITAEFGVLVDDRYQHAGIGTLLIEALIAAARRHGVQDFTAEVLADNAPMMQVLRDLGYELAVERAYGTLLIRFSLAPTARAAQAAADRDHFAAAANPRPVHTGPAENGS